MDVEIQVPGLNHLKFSCASAKSRPAPTYYDEHTAEELYRLASCCKLVEDGGAVAIDQGGADRHASLHVKDVLSGV